MQVAHLLPALVDTRWHNLLSTFVQPRRGFRTELQL